MGTSPKALPTSRELAVLALISDTAHAKGVSQAALAKAARISQPQVSRILGGQRAITLNELIGMLGAVGLSLQDVAHDLGL